MNTNLIIRADANTRIGTGHVMRCLALAQAWQDRGGDVTFISYCDSKALRQRILNEGFEFLPIEKSHPDPSDLKGVLSYLTAIRNPQSSIFNWVVLDGYHFTPDYQKAIRENGYGLLVIDDMAHLNHYHADILLNQNIHASSLSYSCDRDTVKILGCEYVLLRREFLKYMNWKRQIPEKAKKILVTLGGGDPDNVTLKVIKALKLLNDPDLEVKVVVGPNNPHIDTLKNAIHNAPPAPLNRGPLWGVQPGCSMRISQNAENMPKLMAWADVAVSAGGSTCWEMAYMGLPALVITVANNQIGIAKGLSEANIVIELGWYENISIEQLMKAMEEIVQNKDKRFYFSKNGQRLVDGDGCRKIMKVISKD